MKCYDAALENDDKRDLLSLPVRANPGPASSGPLLVYRGLGGTGVNDGDGKSRKRMRKTTLEMVDGVFEEYYDAAAMSQALEIFASTMTARTRRIRELEQYILAHPQKEESTDDPQRVLLKRLRRVDGCQKWIRDLECLSSKPDECGRRCRTVSYGRKRLQVSGSLWGRRYPMCSTKIMLSTYRVPCSVALQGAPREVRQHICSGIYYDVDMVNSFIRIALAKAKTYAIDPPLEMLARYGSDDSVREEMLERIMTHHQIYERDDAKRLPLALLHGGSYQGWLREVRPPVWEPLEWVTTFSNDVGRLLTTMLNRRDGIEVEIVKEKKVLVRDKKRKPYHLHGGIPEVDRTIFASIMQSYEDRLLSIVVDAFCQKGWAVGSLQFDGLYVEPLAGHSIYDAMRFAEQEVRRRTKGEFDVSLKCKDLYGQSSSALLEEWRTAHLAHVGM